MARVFIDDSGSSAEEPLMWVAGWVGQVGTWDVFTDAWHKALIAKNPKPIRYFKHHEARSLTGCFAKFSDTEANTKMIHLAKVIADHSLYGNHSIYGVIYYAFRPFLNAMISKHAVNPVHQNLKDPFFICVNSIIGYVLGSESAKYPNDKVDFIFDGKPGSKQANRLIAMFELVKETQAEPLPSLMGSAIPMNDMDVLPLQAADLLAGQARLAFLEKRPRDPEPLALLRREVPMWIKLVDEETIRATISYHNFGISTRRLHTFKRERESRERKNRKESQ
jgi:hypothetical protein